MLDNGLGSKNELTEQVAMPYNDCRQYADAADTTMPDSEPTTRVVSTRLSLEQVEVLNKALVERGSIADYLRDLIAWDMEARGVSWPSYEVVNNEDRSQRRVRGRGKK